MKRLFLIMALIFIAGCIKTKDFGYGVEQLNSVNARYNTTMETYPTTIANLNLMMQDLTELRKMPLDTEIEPFNYLVDYRLLNIEAEKLYIEGQKYGGAGTTKDGFGCKSMPLIIESATLRNNSATKGFEAVELLREFICKYPEEALLVGLSEKNALFLNATFYEIAKQAKRDSNIIGNFCPKNETLELYRQEFRKKTNLSENLISNLSYEDAVPIWKKIRSIN